MANDGKRAPGRPRSETARQAILTAAAESIAENGYADTTIDAIAARAGVGKQTIYRWWPTKADLILDASSGADEFMVPTTDHGSYRADLRAFLRTAYARAAQPHTADLLRSLMVEAQIRPDFGDRFRTTFLEPRRQAFASITDRAARRGDLPPHPRPDTVADIAFGTLWYRLLATHEPLDRRLLNDVVTTLCPSPGSIRTKAEP